VNHLAADQSLAQGARTGMPSADLRWHDFGGGQNRMPMRTRTIDGFVNLPARRSKAARVRRVPVRLVAACVHARQTIPRPTRSRKGFGRVQAPDRSGLRREPNTSGGLRQAFSAGKRSNHTSPQVRLVGLSKSR